MSYDKKPFAEEKLSGISYWHDTTSYVVIPTTSLNSGAAANTAVTAVFNMKKWKEAVVYVDSSCAVARAGATGLTISLAARPASAIAWQNFNITTGCDESGLTIIRVVGSGLAGTSGQTFFGDVRLLIDNISDSGSATVQAWLFGRTPA